MMNEYCFTLRERRESVGLSQRTLAERAGLDVSTIRYIEQGRTKNPYKYTMGLIDTIIEEERKNKLRILTGSETKK